MKRLPFILFVALCLCLCACSSPAEEETASDTESAVDVLLYFGDANCENILSETVTIPELSPENLINALFEKGVISEVVPVNSFLMDKTGIIRLDLGESFSRMVNSMGTSGEYIMMGSLVNTFLHAYNASGLMLLIDGQTLESGHAIYDFVLEFTPSAN